MSNQKSDLKVQTNDIFLTNKQDDLWHETGSEATRSGLEQDKMGLNFEKAITPMGNPHCAMLVEPCWTNTTWDWQIDHWLQQLGDVRSPPDSRRLRFSNFHMHVRFSGYDIAALPYAYYGHLFTKPVFLVTGPWNSWFLSSGTVFQWIP